jgi:hypothetical protein
MFITNFLNSDLPIYRKVIADSRVQAIPAKYVISSNAFSSNGNLIGGDSSLHVYFDDGVPHDTSYFWKIFDEVRESFNK